MTYSNSPNNAGARGGAGNNQQHTHQDEQLADCREIFCYFDNRGDEKINVKQVGDVLRALGQNPTEAEIKKCCDHWTDPGEWGGGGVRFGLVIGTFLKIQLKSDSPHILKLTNNTNCTPPSSDTRISFEEFVPIYQTVAKSRAHPSLEQFIEGLSHFDREGNGTIAVAELRHLLTTLGRRLPSSY